MKCDGNFGDGYALYALGVPEVAERQEIQSHMDAGCETCHAAIKANMQLWPAFGIAVVPADALPPASLRKRILDAIAGTSVIVMRPSRWSFFGGQVGGRPVAAALLLAAGGVLGWFGTHYLSTPSAAPQQVARNAPSPTANPSQDAARLQARVDELRNSLTVAGAKVADAQKSAASETRKNDAGRQMLSAAQTELARTKTLLVNASNELARAQADLQQNRTELASAQKARQEADDRLLATVADRAQAVRERDRLAGRERTLTAQNLELRQQIAGYREVVDKQSNQAAPLLRLATLLNSPSLRFLHLKGTGGHNGITGSAFVSDNRGVLVYASGLPSLPKGKTYQLWLMRRQSPGIVSGGIFKPDQNGRAFVEVDPSLLTRGVATVAVTDEPDGGSPGPTGTKFLIGVTS